MRMQADLSYLATWGPRNEWPGQPELSTYHTLASGSHAPALAWYMHGKLVGLVSDQIKIIETWVFAVEEVSIRAIFIGLL